MKYKKFVEYYSYSRIHKYYKATKHDKNRTILLYYGNMKIAQAFHPLIGIVEVILRNRLNYELENFFSDGNWLLSQQQGFMVSPLLKYRDRRSGKIRTNDYLLREINKTVAKLSAKNQKITNEQIIAEQSFGFWISFFDLVHYKLLKGAPIKVFHLLPTGYGRKIVFEYLGAIRDFRNRINHNEPICFINSSMDFSYARKIYQAIKDVLSWIDPEIMLSLEGMDQVLRIIDQEEQKQKSNQLIF